MHYAQEKSCYHLTRLNKKALRPPIFQGPEGYVSPLPSSIKLLIKIICSAVRRQIIGLQQLHVPLSYKCFISSGSYYFFLYRLYKKCQWLRNCS